LSNKLDKERKMANEVLVNFMSNYSTVPDHSYVMLRITSEPHIYVESIHLVVSCCRIRM
jgi:hypothetical protein